MFSVGDNLKILFMVSRPDCATVRTTRRLIELNTEFQPSQPSYCLTLASLWLHYLESTRYSPWMMVDECLNYLLACNKFVNEIWNPPIDERYFRMFWNERFRSLLIFPFTCDALLTKFLTLLTVAWRSHTPYRHHRPHYTFSMLDILKFLIIPSSLSAVIKILVTLRMFWLDSLVGLIL